MNRPLISFEPYLPIQEGPGHRRSAGPTASFYRAAQVPADDIASIFEAKENLQAVRSSMLDPSAVKADSVRLAEQALLRQWGSTEPERMKVIIDSLALDLSKILD